MTNESATLLNAECLSQAERVDRELRSRSFQPIKIAFERIDQNMDSQFEHIFQACIGNDTKDAQDRIRSEFLGLGPLEKAILDPTITEIIVTSPQSITIEREGALVAWPDRFLNDRTLLVAIGRIQAQMQNATDSLRPFVDGRIANHRVHIASSWASPNHPQLCMRRIRENRWTLNELEALNAISAEQVAAIKDIIARRLNVLVIGATGSGKTSLLQALLGATGADCRSVIVEDTHELTAPYPTCSHLLTRYATTAEIREITLSDLVRQSLRMRPDRLVVGEVRGAEAKDLLLALSTGHRGSLGTLHAADARDALDRLTMLVQMGAPQWQESTIRRLILSGVDVVMTMERRADKSRGLTRIDRVVSMEQSGFCFEEYRPKPVALVRSALQ